MPGSRSISTMNKSVDEYSFVQPNNCKGSKGDDLQPEGCILTDGGVVALKSQVVFAFDKERCGLVEELLGGLRVLGSDLLK